MCILREQYNKIIVTRWFDEYWGENYNEGVVAELASPTIRMVPSLHLADREGSDREGRRTTRFLRSLRPSSSNGLEEAAERHVPGPAVRTERNDRAGDLFHCQIPQYSDTR
jgi:hypothetical protein